jgi:hypothetical protein
MDKPTKLHRSDTYPHDQAKQENHYQEFFESPDGWYNLIVDQTTDEFVLTTPKDNQIQDCMTEIYKRKDLYHYEDGTIYEWIKLVQSKMNKARLGSGESRSSFTIDDIKYIMRINTRESEVLLTIPRQTRSFNVNQMYLKYGDLPLIQDSFLDDQIRIRLEQKGFDLPRIPYSVGIGLKMVPKFTNASDV